MSALLDIRALSVRLPAGADRPHALEAIDLALAPDEILCVVGESGSGKSMMANAVMGLLPGPQVFAEAGEVIFEGRDLLRLPPKEMQALRGERIAMIFQEPMTALNPLMRIGRQIGEVLAIHRAMDRAARRTRVRELLAAVQLPDPDGIAQAYPHQVSGGQRQRAMIAMALALEPKVLIADEPTTALDVTTQAQILRLIRELQRARGTGVLFITHDFGVVAEIADRVAVMQHGRIVETGPASQVLNRPQHPYTRRLVGAVPSLVPPAPPPRAEAPAVLSVEGLRKTFQARRALFRRGRAAVDAVRNARFTLHRGETLGIVGESGSGKSTVARCLTRLVDPDGGTIRLGPVDLAALGRRALRPYRKRVQMVFQDPFASLNPRRKVGQLIAQGPMVHGTSRRDAYARAAELLALVGLDPKAIDRFPHEFSGGQRQRIGIARALALEPEILVADEPVSALDVSVQEQVLRLLADIRARLQLSMVFITHDLRVAAQVCDRILVMRAGEIVEEGTAVRLFADPRHPYTRELLDSVPGRGWTPPRPDA